MKSVPTFPPRLLELDGAASDCLRSAEQALERAPIPSFERVRERRLQRQKRRAALGAACAFAVLGLGYSLLLEQRPALSISAEGPSIMAPVRPAPATLPSSAVQSDFVEPDTAPPTVESPAERAALRGEKTHPRVKAQPAPQAPEASASARVCAEHARQGDVARAIGCYDALAAGSGARAELALFERARL
jgi:hypothetical protein